MQRPSALPSRQLDNFHSSGNGLSSFSALAKPLAAACLFLVIGAGLQSTNGLRFVLTGFLFLLLAILLWKHPKLGVTCIFIYLALLGGIRRWLIPDFGWPAYDPLVLVGAVIPLLSFVPLVISRKVPSDTKLSLYVKYLIVVMAFQVANPLQGGIFVGLGGILYYLAPLLWFYIGRFYGNANILIYLFKLSAVFYTMTGLYGIKQVVIGLAPSEQQWMKLGGYESLNVSADAIRVFSTFASQQEYAITLSVALSICATFFINRKFQYLPLLLVLTPALFLTAARGPVVYLMFAAAVQWAVNSRNRAIVLPRIGLALLLGVTGLGWSLSHVNTDSLSAGQSDLFRHQQEGLLNPGDSTAPDHLLMVGAGILSGFKQPLGVGLGATTMAAGKLGGGVGGSEMDFGNLFISLGAVGGIIYGIVIFFVFKQTSIMWYESRDMVYMGLMGLLIACFGQWLSGGLYSLCFLVWFSIGVMDREFALKKAAEAPAISATTKTGFRNPRRKFTGRHIPLPSKSLR